MTIAEAAGKCKSLVARVPKDAFILAILLLSASASFALGYLSGREAGLQVSAGQGTATAAIITPLPSDGRVVASKNGTKYYPVMCAGASRLSSATKITFASASAAEAAGYTLATGCKGL